ncbi:THO complex, subunit 5s [Actinidia rufa]|uniref:THO complex, subunit 5s n=1 Tax=Actinidia rufa TaxID=165716 RepID=A0A7J0EMP8_9ERIC|nr:THO complex, subunit 5s [Actinidia rufa]
MEVTMEDGEVVEAEVAELKPRRRDSAEDIVAQMLSIKREGKPKSELRELVTHMFLNFVTLRQVLLFDFYMDEGAPGLEKRTGAFVVDAGLCKPVSGKLLARSYRGRDHRNIISWKDKSPDKAEEYLAAVDELIKLTEDKDKDWDRAEIGIQLVMSRLEDESPRTLGKGLQSVGEERGRRCLLNSGREGRAW